MSRKKGFHWSGWITAMVAILMIFVLCACADVFSPEMDRDRETGEETSSHQVVSEPDSHQAVSEPGSQAVDGYKQILQWTEDFMAQDYFRFNERMLWTGEPQNHEPVHHETRSFDWREQLEAEQVIPFMEEYPIFYCIGSYQEDESLHSVRFIWEQYTENTFEDTVVRIVVAYEDAVEDEFSFEPALYVTVVERDGIRILVEGDEDSEKTITFIREGIWYQVKVPPQSTYAEAVMLLDWLWEHPVDLSRYPMAAGDHYVGASYRDVPDAFAGYIPDMSAYGFLPHMDGEYFAVRLKNGEPVYFYGEYIAHAPAQQIKDGSYRDTEGWTSISLNISAEPGYYELRNNLGKLEDLTEQQIKAVLEEDSSITFLWKDHLYRIYTNSPEEVWTILQEMRTQ